MLAQALDCSALPVYLVFQSDPVPHLCRYFAKAYVSPGPAPDRKPLNLQGKPMPTPELAVQMAAAGAISRLRILFPQAAEMPEFRYFPSLTDKVGECSICVGDVDPAIACLVQYIDSQGMLLSGIIREFQALDLDTTRVVTGAYRAAREAASQATRSLLPNPVPPSLLVPPSQPVSSYRPGIIRPASFARAIRRLRRRDVFRQEHIAAPAVVPQPIVVPDDEDGSWLSLRLPGEPQPE